MCMITTYGFVYRCVTQYRLCYSFFNYRPQTTLSSMHTLQVWVRKRFYIISGVCKVCCTHITTVSRIDVTSKKHLIFNKSTFGDLKYSSHVLIYFFHCNILAILSSDKKYNFIAHLSYFVTCATMKLLMNIFTKIRIPCNWRKKSHNIA